MAISSKLLLQGTFRANQVSIRHTISSRLTDPALEKRIDNIWQAQQAKGKERGDTLWDAEAYRLNGCSIEGGKLVLEVAPIQYKVHAAMKELHSEPDISEAHLDRLLATDALIKTSDSKYILGQADKVAEQGVILLGGSCSKQRVTLTSASDLFNFVRKRIADLLAISGNDLGEPMLRGIVLNEHGGVSLVFYITTPLSSQTINERFLPNNGVSSLVFVEKEKLRDYLLSAEGYVKEVNRLIGRGGGVVG